jgi:hypothetical protein
LTRFNKGFFGHLERFSSEEGSAIWRFIGSVGLWYGLLYSGLPLCKLRILLH